MTGVFFTTIVICTMTGLVIITSGLLDSSTLDGGILSNAAFNAGMSGDMGMYVVSIGLVFFLHHDYWLELLRQRAVHGVSDR